MVQLETRLTAYLLNHRLPGIDPMLKKKKCYACTAPCKCNKVLFTVLTACPILSIKRRPK